MKKTILIFTTIGALAVAGVIYGFTSNNTESKGCCKPDGVTCVDYETCPKKGQPDCPLIENCPMKGTPECPLANGEEKGGCCEKK